MLDEIQFQNLKKIAIIAGLRKEKGLPEEDDEDENHVDP